MSGSSPQYTDPTTPDPSQEIIQVPIDPRTQFSQRPEKLRSNRSRVMIFMLVLVIIILGYAILLYRNDIVRPITRGPLGITSQVSRA